MAEISVPERFVHAWSEVQAMPNDTYSMACLKNEAEEIIRDALRHARNIARAANLLQKSIDEQEVPGHG